LFLFDFIPTPTWRDLADILFLTFVAYQLFVWFRGTRAIRVLIGLVVLGVIYSLAKLWGLFLTTWVLQILWQVLVILLLILFQSEIRQVLEKVSPLQYLRARRRSSYNTILNELSKAVFDLALGRTGALIVLVRDDDPTEFLHAGQTIMALPDPVLIKTIFNRHTSTHDGAIIISQGYLAQMGCILPLSEREDIPEQYGTRHRAALGLSERTDAVCIVVSEERAKVSTVTGREIKTWKDPASLISELARLLNVSETQGFTMKGVFTRALLQNWGTKLLALFLVSIAWMILASQQEVKVNVAAPVRYTNLSPSLELDEKTAQTVRLALSGRRHSVRTLSDRDVRVNIDLGNLTKGTHMIKLSSKNIDLPLGMMTDRVTPQDLQIILKLSGPE